MDWLYGIGTLIVYTLIIIILIKRSAKATKDSPKKRRKRFKIVHGNKK